jgi:hypothetical protein
MDTEVFFDLTIIAFLGSLIFGLRLAVRSLKRRCDETQAEIRRLVRLCEPRSIR